MTIMRTYRISYSTPGGQRKRLELKAQSCVIALDRFEHLARVYKLELLGDVELVS